MEGFGRTDNCLIDPNLKVSKSNADVVGQHMDYWPAYENMRPSSRRAFLEWLSGDRADPDTYIGYVFLYLYGLERRGVLERAVEDHAAIRAEVERLLASTAITAPSAVTPAISSRRSTSSTSRRARIRPCLRPKRR